VTRDEAWSLANHWVAAWNAHDLDLIMIHYDDAIELTSPVVAQLFGTSEGKVVGKASLRTYFQRGLETYPELRFHLEDVLWSVNSVMLYYTNQKGSRTGEFMELSPIGKVKRVVALQCLTRRSHCGVSWRYEKAMRKAFLSGSTDRTLSVVAELKWRLPPSPPKP
jgi:predicted ester cyclase